MMLTKGSLVAGDLPGPYWICCTMATDALATFRDYLESLPDDLLESVTGDYVWLGTLKFDDAGREIDFRGRRECCRDECVRRGTPQIYNDAERIVCPLAA